MVGRLAQSVERRLHTAEVAGSIPVPPTMFPLPPGRGLLFGLGFGESGNPECVKVPVGLLTLSA